MFTRNRCRSPTATAVVRRFSRRRTRGEIPLHDGLRAKCVINYNVLADYFATRRPFFFFLSGARRRLARDVNNLWRNGRNVYNLHAGTRVRGRTRRRRVTVESIGPVLSLYGRKTANPTITRRSKRSNHCLFEQSGSLSSLLCVRVNLEL